MDAGAYQALYLHHDSFDATPHASLTFWIHGGTVGGQARQLQANVNGNALPAVAVPAPQANTWQQVALSLANLGGQAQASFDGFWLQSTTGATLPTFYVDDIALVANPTVSGDLADPDGDGIVNLLENAFNLDPLSAGRAGLPTVAPTIQNGTTNLPLTYPAECAAESMSGGVLSMRHLRSLRLCCPSKTLPHFIHEHF